MTEKGRIRLLAIGNSFSVDTLEYLPNVARSAGYDDILVGNLYIGGCSLNRHYKNAVENLSEYVYFENKGDVWERREGVAISEALLRYDWDIISIQHGTGDKSRYTSPESYSNLEGLIKYVKERVGKNTKVVFNMAWVGERDYPHHELLSYGSDQVLMYKSLANLTRELVLNTEGVDAVIPTGTAVQNARTSKLRNRISRDGYHVSLVFGRFLTSLTYFSYLFQCAPESVLWRPEQLSEEEYAVAVESARGAIASPFGITDSKFL